MHAVVPSLGMLAAATASDPVTSFFQTWAGYAQGWVKYVAIICVVLGFILFTIGSHRGWAHLREAVAGAIFVSIVLALLPTLFP